MILDAYDLSATILYFQNKDINALSFYTLKHVDDSQFPRLQIKITHEKIIFKELFIRHCVDKNTCRTVKLNDAHTRNKH